MGKSSCRRNCCASDHMLGVAGSLLAHTCPQTGIQSSTQQEVPGALHSLKISGVFQVPRKEILKRVGSLLSLKRLRFKKKKGYIKIHFKFSFLNYWQQRETHIHLSTSPTAAAPSACPWSTYSPACSSNRNSIQRSSALLWVLDSYGTLPL